MFDGVVGDRVLFETSESEYSTPLPKACQTCQGLSAIYASYAGLSEKSIRESQKKASSGFATTTYSVINGKGIIPLCCM